MDDHGNFTWVKFDPIFHTLLVCRALLLLPPLCPVAKGKQVMFILLLEVLTGKEGARWSGLLFFALPEKKCWVYKQPLKANASLPVPHPTQAPLVAVTRAWSSVTSTPSHFPLNWMESFPPKLITLSQVEDLVAMHKMIQALHARTPPLPFPHPPLPWSLMWVQFSPSSLLPPQV